MVNGSLLRGMLAFFTICAVGFTAIPTTDAQRFGWPSVPSFTTSCGNSTTLSNIYRYGRFCNDILHTWYYDNILSKGFSSRRPNEVHTLEFQKTTELWDEICQWNHVMARCYDNLVSQCSPGIGVELLGNPQFFVFPGRGDDESIVIYTGPFLGFYRRTCQGNTVKPDIQQKISDASFDINITCINQTDQLEINKCLNIFVGEDLNRNLYATSTAIFNRINQLAESSVNCMYSAINRSPCNQATKRVMYHVAKLQLPNFIDENSLNLDESTTEDFSALLRCTIGVYGDPHLRMCFEPGLTTCSARGYRTLIANGWFLVTGEHKPIGREGTPPATSLRSIQIILRSVDTTRTVAVYSASNGDLPSAFDGTTATTAGQGDDEVTLIQRGNRREIIQHSTGMVLALRQWRGNYFFTLRVAQNVVKRSYGLLATGCPAGEVIARSTWQWFQARRRKRAVTQDQCGAVCNDTINDESFRQICAFDCFVLDDIEVALNITSLAMEDTEALEKIDSEIRERALSRPKPKKPKKPNTSSAPSMVNRYNVVLSVLIFVAVRGLCTH